jgi:hypothetical protein
MQFALRWFIPPESTRDIEFHVKIGDARPCYEYRRIWSMEIRVAGNRR